PIAFHPHAPGAPAVAGVVDHVIDHSHKVAMDADNESAPRELIRAQAHPLALGRGTAPAERLQVGAIDLVAAAVVGIKRAHAAAAPFSLVPKVADAVARRARRIYVPDLGHR